MRYEVQHKDTLLGVALKFRTATEIIKYMNKIENDITPGQVGYSLTFKILRQC